MNCHTTTELIGGTQYSYRFTIEMVCSFKSELNVPLARTETGIWGKRSITGI